MRLGQYRISFAWQERSKLQWHWMIGLLLERHGWRDGKAVGIRIKYIGPA